MLDELMTRLGDLYPVVAQYAGKIILAAITLIVGFWVIGKITKLVLRGLDRSGTDESLKGFLKSLVSILLKVALLIAVINTLGIDTTSFVAILGAAGLAVGLALQGSLANFAGGVLILLFRPFKVGDLIEGEGHTGHVEEINIFVTKIKTPDNKTVIIPNGPLSNGSITNYSSLGKLRVDLVVGISYDADIQEARNVIMDVMKNDEQVLEDPAPSVNVLELGDSSVNLAVRPYATPDDYWDVYFGTYEKVKIALDKAGIEIPYPHEVQITK